MKPAPFDYTAPGSLDEALEILDQRADEAKLLAGGQSLVPLLNMRLARPALLVDLNRLSDLAYVRSDDGVVRIGALTRQREVERSAAVRERVPLLGAATEYIGHPAIRNRGTVGGSLAHGDPVSELPCVAVALDAALVAHGPKGERRIPADAFFQSVFTTSLEPNEILTEVVIPAPPSGTGWGFEELARRHGDFGILGVAALLTLKRDGTIERARLGYAGAADRPLRAGRAEKALIGQRPSAATFEEAARLASSELDPPDDMHATAAYRRTVAIALTKRALAAAERRATESAGG
jgi:carbon-monoxide dehydrogenase medium subunit